MGWCVGVCGCCVCTDSLDASKTWDPTVEFCEWSWGRNDRPKTFEAKHLAASSSKAGGGAGASSNSSSSSSSASSKSSKSKNKRKKPTGKEEVPEQDEDPASSALVAKRGSAQQQRKAQRKTAAILRQPSLLGELSEEVESDREQDFVNELSDDEEEKQAESDEDEDVEMDWKLGVDLSEPIDTFEGVGQSSVPITGTTSARYCFDMVFPATVRALILKETNRYGIFFADWRVRSGKPNVPWVHLEDAELCVFFGLVLVQIRVFFFLINPYLHSVIHTHAPL
jgi:hypothetical protein